MVVGQHDLLSGHYKEGTCKEKRNAVGRVAGLLLVMGWKFEGHWGQALI
jgi:hypothetical protein